MFRIVLFIAFISIVFIATFAWSLPSSILLNDYIEKPQVRSVNYQSQDDEKNSKSDEDPPRIVSFKELLNTSFKGKFSKGLFPKIGYLPNLGYISVVKMYSVWRNGFGGNVKFKTKVDKRFFKMFKRMAFYYGLTDRSDAIFRLSDPKHADSLSEFRFYFRVFYILYLHYAQEGYSRDVQLNIEGFQKILVSDLNYAEKQLKKAKLVAKKKALKRKIGYSKGMLKELGRLIRHLDKQ